MRIIRKGWAILTVSMFLFAGLINTNSSPAGQVQKDSVVAVVAGANGLPWVSADKLPPHGTFWLVMNEGSFLLPMPFRPDDLKSAPAFLLSDDGSFLVDATGGILPQPTKRQAAHGVTSADLVKAQAQAIQDLIAQVQEARLNTELGALPGVKGGMQRMAMGLMGMGYGADDLWLEVLQVDMTNQFADLRLHGTVDTNQYQLLYTNNLAVPGNQWTLGAIKYGDYGTNQTDYPNVLIGTNSQMFYRAHQASAVLYLSAGQNAVEPRGTDPGQPGMVYIGGSGLTNDLAVYYRASGDAQGGIDYSNLSGVITLTNAFGSGFAEINVQPMADNLLEGAEKLTLTLVQTNQYLISPNSSSATIFVEDSSTTVIIYPVGDAVEPNGPPGIPAQSGYFALDRYDERGIYTNSLDVLYRVSGTASNGVDYTFLTGLFHFAPGISLTNMEVSPLTDNLTEGLETVTVTLIPTNTYLTNTNYLSAEVTIVDTTTTITLSAIDSDAVEPNGPPGVPAKLALFTVSRTDSRGLYTNALNVFYQISGTASNGVDYALLTGVLHFDPDIYSTNLVVNPLADNVAEGLETVSVLLVATNGYIVDTNFAAATGTIADSTTTVSIFFGQDAVETNTASTTPGQVGYFQVTRNDTRNATSNLLTIYYQVSGTASNGVDYTNLPGRVTFAPNEITTNIYVQTLSDNVFEGDETVTLSLVATNGYLVNSNQSTATLFILDNLATNVFVPVVTGLTGPIGIDYHAASNSIIVSYNFTGGNPYNFARIYTNLIVSNSIVITNTMVTNWSGVHGVLEEVKLATAKTNAGGFTNGDLLFGSNTGIGFLSADGTRSNLNWCVLTNSAVTNVLLLRGSLYVDQTGIFSNNIIAVTSGGLVSSPRKGVWRVDAQAHPTLLADLQTSHLEGVITLPNNTTNWGPWAGKIVTGDESALPAPLIYTIATNGAVENFDTTSLIFRGIHPEDFDIIPPNQSLYMCDFSGNRIMKLPASYLTNYVGDLLITDAGEVSPPAKLFILHWNPTTANFITHRISYYGGSLEHVTFAPIDIPPK